MANQRQPIQLIQAKGKKHLTKNEIAERTNSEISPITDGIAPPEYLSKKQKERFEEIAADLCALGIMGNTDCDALARYVEAEAMYIKISRILRRREVIEDIYMLEKYCAIQDKYFKQCRSAANDLGLSISSRCKLVVPKAADPPRENKFSRFSAG